ncbi:DUF4227 family protein [Paenibacillus sp. GCM10012307]|uniref:YqzK family protein n=1 Tax=Paenibacillus roseus TaxID=2798579 RepID=A0A934JAH9_9BACL|nr:DUF4227 family protein [Paenibacillus roseus]MBJ6363457.1 YqzK family protein [Paenibacillus roseus]
MVFSLRKWLSRFAFLILFVLLTVLVFGGYRFFMTKLMLVDPYEAPHGQALKVFQPNGGEPEKASISDRLRWFYLYGE